MLSGNLLVERTISLWLKNSHFSAQLSLRLINFRSNEDILHSTNRRKRFHQNQNQENVPSTEWSPNRGTTYYHGKELYSILSIGGENLKGYYDQR